MGALVRLVRSVPRVNSSRPKKRVKTSRNDTKVELVGVKFEPRHWEALASGLADSGSRVERLQLVEVPNYNILEV